jgi:hypothetical protein
VDAKFASEILAKLKAKYDFRKTRGKWMQEGKCPDCNERELFAAAEDPKVVRCGRQNNCQFEISVRDALPDLFDDWSKRFEKTEQDPNAAADAYLRSRGIDLTGLRDAFSQETYHDHKRNITSATVRFSLPGGSHWERLIDRPGRFDKKAHFKFGGTWAGHCWAHPDDDWKALAAMDEIWIAEGIFDALALRQNFQRLTKKGDPLKRTAVSAMSCNTWPEKFLEALRDAIRTCNPKHRPAIVFAFDVGPAGVKFTRKFVPQAQRDGWDAGAAILRPDGEGTKLDWNDLWLRQQDHKGDSGKGPLDQAALDDFRYNGDVTLAKTPTAKARLIYERKKLASFHFRFENRTFWSRPRVDPEDGGANLNVEEVANCAFRILYRERDEAADETNYFLEVAFPNSRTPTAKARFSAACCAAGGEFKKRLFAFSGMWLGSQEQLDRLMRDQTRQLKTVEPIHFTGYSAAHDAWVLGDIAVRDGRVLKLNSERYFDVGKSAVKLRSEERTLSITYDPDRLQLGWIDDLWTAYGERGIVALAFFTMSLFAVQIRAQHQSVGFLEVCGEAGSGKTTLMVFLWKLLGRTGYEGFDPNKGTAAGTARNFIKVSNLPVGLIESGRDEEKRHAARFDPAELLTLFNGRSPRVLGVKSGGTETFEPPFLGTIYLMQNEPIDAMTAVLERIMSFRLDKGVRSDRTRDAARRLSAARIEDVSGWIVHVTRQAEEYLKKYFARVEHHDAAMRKRVPDLHNDRIILNHSQLAAAVELLGLLIPEKQLPRDWLKATVAFVDRIALDRQQASGGDHPVVQRFWEMVDVLISAEKDDQHAEGTSLNQSTKPGEYLAISLVEFEKRARTNQLQPPSDMDLKKHLRGSRSRKFVKVGTVTNPAGRSVHCWLFERHPSEKPVI